MPAVDVPDSHYDPGTFIPGAVPEAENPLSSVTSTNPKDRIGVNKPPIHLVPPVAIIHTAMAFKDGAKKYGPYNWRGESVSASVYIAACYRHLMAWFDGENFAVDSGVHHLGHAIACLSIILDADSTKKLVDDRPPAGLSSVLLSMYTNSEKGNTNEHEQRRQSESTPHSPD